MGVGFRPGEGVSYMIDVQKFSGEVVEEAKRRFPSLTSEDGELGSQIVSLIATVAAIAIEKYDREREA